MQQISPGISSNLWDMLKGWYLDTQQTSNFKTQLVMCNDVLISHSIIYTCFTN